MQDLINILGSLESESQSLHLSLTQKGVIIELTSKLCLIEYQLLTKYLGDFKDKVYGGRFGLVDKSSSRKKRTNEGRTTTARKKK